MTEEQTDLMRNFTEGEIIIKEGEVGNRLYIVHEGTVRISKTVLGKEKILADLAQGDFFGEMSLINEKPRTADATALSDVKVLVLDWATFKRRITQYPIVASKIIKTLAQRLDQTLNIVENLFHVNASSRVAREIALLIDAEGVLGEDTAVRVALDIETLARQTGLENQEVSYQLERLRELKLIEAADNEVKILSTMLFQTHLQRLEKIELEDAL